MLPRKFIHSPHVSLALFLQHIEFFLRERYHNTRHRMFNTKQEMLQELLKLVSNQIVSTPRVKFARYHLGFTCIVQQMIKIPSPLLHSHLTSFKFFLTAAKCLIFSQMRRILTWGAISFSKLIALPQTNILSANSLRKSGTASPVYFVMTT